MNHKPTDPLLHVLLHKVKLLTGILNLQNVRKYLPMYICLWIKKSFQKLLFSEELNLLVKPECIKWVL